MTIINSNDNQAAFLTGPKVRPLEVGAGPEHVPGGDEVVIKVAYAEVNPVDWQVQTMDFLITAFPNVLGCGVAGEIVQVGKDVTQLKKGQRVIGHCVGLGNNKPTHGGYQLYATLPARTVAPIPDSLPLANAAVLPLSISTAASALFTKSALGLALPPTSTTTTKPSGKTILIWGGSSSVGSSSIQLAVAAGLTVATTASARNHDYVRSLGATHVFDHASPTVANDIVQALQGTEFVGVFAAIENEASIRASAEVTSKLAGKETVAKVAFYPAPEGLPSGVNVVTVSALVPSYEEREIGAAIWGKFLPEALAAGKFQAKPDPLIIKGGLGKVQEAMDLQKKGVSAKKIVVEVAKDVV